MKLVFVHSHKFIKLNENYYTTGQLPYELFKTRYLNNFEKVVVCSRVINGDDIKGLNKSNGKDVTIKKLPNLSILKQRRHAINSSKKTLEKEIKKADIVVARMPSAYSNLAIKIAEENGKPFIVEVVGDVFASLWNHGSIIGKLIAPITAIKHKKAIRKSKYTIYVTANYLQKKYPSSQGAYTINASNVEVDKASQSVLNKKIKKEKERNYNKIKIGLIGSFTSKYKGIHNGIDLVAQLNHNGISAELHILGHGNNDWLIKKAKRLNVLNKIYFHNLLPSGKPVLEWLDKLDIYIQPSLTEGLPRGLIEAMSRGLPSVASNVGGIPELLESQFLHKPNDSEDLINKVVRLIDNKNEMFNQAEKNFEKAQKYSTEVLREKRKQFWNDVIKKEQLK